MRDDLRVLVEQDFPRLAFQIADAGPRWMYNRAHFGNRVNWSHDEYNQYAAAEAEGGVLRYAGPIERDGTDGYHYKALHKDGGLNHLWYIAFYNVRLIDVEDVDPQPVQVLNPGEVHLVQVDSNDNDGPSFIDYEIDREKEEIRGSEHSFGATASTEFEATVSRSLGASVGPLSGKAEMTARFAAKLEARTDHAWRKSDRLTDKVKKSFRQFPYSSLEVTVQRGMPQLRQVIPTTGLLECNIQIDIRDANDQRFSSYDELVNVWRGLKSGHEFYSDFFGGGHAVHEDVIDGWRRPRLTLDLEVEGRRVRYSKSDYVTKPIPGREALFEQYRLADLAAPKG